MSAPYLTAVVAGPPPWLLRRRRVTGIIAPRQIVTHDSQDPYVLHHDVIERALAETCRQKRMLQEQAEEFMSAARIRLLDDDRAILRKYSGASSFRTYIAVVVSRLYIDWCNSEWGRWRPSAEARRQGDVAIELERLVFRDRWAVEEAIEHVVSSGRASRRDCEDVWRLLPRAPRHSTLPLDDGIDVPDATQTSTDLLAEREQGRRVLASLDRAIHQLPTDDRLLVRLQYWRNCTVAEIARMQGLDQRELYRRFVRIREHLKRVLESDGVGSSTIAEILGRLDTLP